MAKGTNQRKALKKPSQKKLKKAAVVQVSL
jgi:hypothetical protein